MSCWGFNGQGQLGVGAGVVSSPDAMAVPTIADAIDVAAGSTHTCALLAGGRLRCWGSNAHGRLGDGTRTDRTSPVSVVGL